MALEAAVELEATTRAPSRARAFTQEALHRWDLDDLGELAALLVSELVTNAILHAGSPVHLCVRRARGSVRVEVHDKSPVLPSPAEPGGTAEGGRGLHLVSELAQDHGSESVRGDGKIVWFELAAV